MYNDNNCIGFIGIYLQLGEACYSNGSYFAEGRLKQVSLKCGLPDYNLNGGQWIGPNGAVLCPGNNSNIHCLVMSNTSLGVHIPNEDDVDLEPAGDGWYKCCLPTSCSDSNTNIITANIFSK